MRGRWACFGLRSARGILTGLHHESGRQDAGGEDLGLRTAGPTLVARIRGYVRPAARWRRGLEVVHDAWLTSGKDARLCVPRGSRVARI